MDLIQTKRSQCLSKTWKNSKSLKYHVEHSILWLYVAKDSCLALGKGNMASLVSTDRKEKEYSWSLKRLSSIESARTKQLFLTKTM
jgi:hypothetical protein